MTVTAPFAKPTASCDRFSRVANADIYVYQHGHGTKALVFVTHRELFPPILYVQRRKTFWGTGFFFRLIKRPDFQNGLVREIFSNGDQQCRAIQLFHLSDRSSIMSFERPQDLESLRKNPDVAIVAANKKGFGSRANTAEVAGLSSSAR